MMNAAAAVVVVVVSCVNVVIVGGILCHNLRIVQVEIKSRGRQIFVFIFN